MKTETFILENSFDRADVLVASLLNITRSAAAKIIDGDCVKVNQKSIKKKDKISAGSQVIITIPDPVPDRATAEDIPLEIVYEDDDLLIVNKQQGMVVHPAPGNYDGTLVNALLHHCKGRLSGINGTLRPGIIHRIDKNTSGLLIVAKNDKAHNFLSTQIKAHSFTREYEAVVHGLIKSEKGKIEAPIGRNSNNRKKMAVTNKNSKNAVTYYEVIVRGNKFTHVRLRLETGRTHQIRVHMSYIGHPVAGDDLYGPSKSMLGLSGQCLHAKKIGFIHPSTNEYMEFDSCLPDYFKQFLKKI